MLQKGLLQWTYVSDNCALNNGVAIGAVITDFLVVVAGFLAPEMRSSRCRRILDLRTRRGLGSIDCF